MRAHHPGILLILLLLTFPQFSETVYAPVLPGVSEAFSVSSNLAQLTMSLYFGGFAMGVLCWGYLADRMGRRNSMIAGLVIYGLSALMAVVSENFWEFLVARIALAFGASAGSVVVQTMIRDCYEGKELARFFSLVGVALSLSPTLGPALGGMLAESSGLNGVLFALVSLAVLLLIWTLVKLPETQHVQSGNNQSRLSILALSGKMMGDRRIICSVVLVAGMNILLFGYYTMGPFVIAKMGFSQQVFGFSGILMALGTAIGALLNRSLIQRVSIEKLILWGCMLALTGSCLQWLVSAIDVGSQKIHLVLFLLPLLLIVTGFGLTIPNVLGTALVDYKAQLGTAGALLGLFYYLVIMAGLGALSAWYLDELWYMPVNFVAISSLLVLMAKFRSYTAERT
ncbi:multidrug effflux MFS transporter [Endozoicomonas numazuensis]|uniref:multidrug effflux MFS transporter n=1 Tax=Endozoicomonas numazuensis TaxID=1137799 RepID=UPI000555FE8B|nr:multidrug effflux MFS transporter [Endozoicomonas numazuensis]